MVSIANQLANPEWWFSVVVVGLVVGVIAAYAKDWLSAVLGRVSHTFRDFADRQIAKESEHIELLLAVPSLLTIEYIRSCIEFAGAVLLLALALVMPAWVLLQRTFPEVDPASLFFGVQASRPSTIQPVLSLVMIVSGLVLWTVGIARINVCTRARSLLIERSRAHVGKR